MVKDMDKILIIIIFNILQIRLMMGGRRMDNVDGDILLGGLFPVHKKSYNTDSPCGLIQSERGIQRLEAMLFAIDEINNRKDILPGITLGARIRDTCSRDTHAVQKSMDFLDLSMGSISCRQSDAKPVVAVIGGSYSSVSIQVGNDQKISYLSLVFIHSCRVKIQQPENSAFIQKYSTFFLFLSLINLFKFFFHR